MKKIAMLVFALSLLATGFGCGSSSETKPNSELQVPSIPSGKRSMPGEGGKINKKAETKTQPN